MTVSDKADLRSYLEMVYVISQMVIISDRGYMQAEKFKEIVRKQNFTVPGRRFILTADLSNLST